MLVFQRTGRRANGQLAESSAAPGSHLGLRSGLGATSPGQCPSQDHQTRQFLTQMMTPGRFPAPLSHCHVGVPFCPLFQSALRSSSGEALRPQQLLSAAGFPVAPEASASLWQNDLGATLMHIAQLGIEKVWKFRNQI